MMPQGLKPLLPKSNIEGFGFAPGLKPSHTLLYGTAEAVP